MNNDKNISLKQYCLLSSVTYSFYFSKLSTVMYVQYDYLKRIWSTLTPRWICLQIFTTKKDFQNITMLRWKYSKYSLITTKSLWLEQKKKCFWSICGITDHLSFTLLTFTIWLIYLSFYFRLQKSVEPEIIRDGNKIEKIKFNPIPTSPLIVYHVTKPVRNRVKQPLDFSDEL